MLLRNRYQIISELGRGGFGKTYLAEDHDHPKRQKVVVKELIPLDDQIRFQLFRERFEKEAERLAELAKGSNGGIPEFHARFTENERCYIVQEFIDGGSLSAKLKKEGVLSEAFVLEFLKRILPVLDYIHTQPNPIIHRDIKPDNIMLRSTTGQPVLIDFGIVKDVTQIDSYGNPTSSILAGTPGFMPLEQGAGRPVFSSDLFALGMTAIVLMTGKSPKEMTNPLTGEIDWRKFVPEINPEFAVALDKAIRPMFQERFPTAIRMLEAIRDLAAGDPRFSDRTEIASIEPGFYNKTTKLDPPPSGREAPRDSPVPLNPNVVPVSVESETPLPAASKPSLAPTPPIVPASPSPSGRAIHFSESELSHRAIVDGSQGDARDRERKGQAGIVKVAALTVVGLAILGAGGFGARWLFSSKPVNFADEGKLPPTTVSPPPLATPVIGPPPGMVFIKGGMFRMGNTEAMKEDKAEGPEHEVTVGDFYMDRTEVTNEQYAKFAGAENIPFTFQRGEENFPVVNVTWNDAVAYAKWAGKRLPTEEEWEYAARGTDGRLYPWGNTFSPDMANVREAGVGKPVAVEAYSKSQSPFGLLGMCGNVAEWVAGDYKPYPNSQAKPISGQKIQRGGSYVQDVSFARATSRALGEPSKTKSPALGFRCAQDISTWKGK